MLNIVLNNVDHVEHTREVIRERFEPLLREFPDLRDHQVTVVVEGVASDPNAPLSVRASVQGSKYRGLALVRKVGDIYGATTKLARRMVTLLRRASRRARARSVFRLQPLVANAV
jgi:ribosome-associated translation inhibitor RaiA